MPLLGDQRLNGREVVESRQHLSVGAVRTAVAALHALRNHRTIGVAFFASPPHTAIRARGDIVWMEHAVFLLVPLRGNVRVQRRKIVFTGQRLPSGADRTARAEGRPRIHRRITWRRCVDMNDRQLRFVVDGLGGRVNGTPREDGYDITVASEIMAVLCLASDITDLKERLSRLVVGYTYDEKPVTAGDLNAQGAMTSPFLPPGVVQPLAGGE